MAAHGAAHLRGDALGDAAQGGRGARFLFAFRLALAVVLLVVGHQGRDEHRLHKAPGVQANQRLARAVGVAPELRELGARRQTRRGHGRPQRLAQVRHLVRVEHAALPNLIAGREIVLELLQGDLRAESLAEALLGYLGAPARAQAARAALAEVRRAVGKPDTFGLAAQAVLEEIGPRPGRSQDRERTHENQDRTPKTRKGL